MHERPGVAWRLWENDPAADVEKKGRAKESECSAGEEESGRAGGWGRGTRMSRVAKKESASRRNKKRKTSD